MPTYEAMRAPVNRMRYHEGQQQAERALQPEDDPQSLFTEAVLYGLKARLCDEVDSLDSYLPPQVAQLARKTRDCDVGLARCGGQGIGRSGQIAALP
ncbi:hypothetical protein OG906_42595 (plasmid) [Streptomyces sp. NBC_01426]|uniref:hypothetical protein n=1 Tax=Streptomyces sp. NBC_01426 TaxID=2975866 RepID=UPI002E355B44|nr:hypothetical protein [Streptomyces sp. NBC_01426]